MAKYSVPPEFYSCLLPAADLTIPQLLKYHLPFVLPSFPLTKTEGFFDPLPASQVDIAAIQDVPSPPLPVVQALQKDLEIGVSTQHRSIRCIHAPSASEKTYPLWIVTYWEEMFVVRQARDTWMVTEDNLRKKSQLWKAKGKSESLRVIDQCRAALSVIRWGDKLCGFSPDSEEDLKSLALYTSDEWLRGAHANQMLDLLQRDLQRDGKNHIDLGNSYFYAKIRLGSEDPEKYSTTDSFRLYRYIGNALETGMRDQFGFLANLDMNHWVAVVFDFRKRETWFGDSLGGVATAPVRKVLNWWTQFHSGQEFTYRQLPITIQQDSFSCCLLAWNALRVFFSDSKETLLAPQDVAECRLKVLLQVIHEHQSRAMLSTDVRRSYMGVPPNEDNLNQMVNEAQNPSQMSVDTPAPSKAEPLHSHSIAKQISFASKRQVWDYLSRPSLYELLEGLEAELILTREQLEEVKGTKDTLAAHLPSVTDGLEDCRKRVRDLENSDVLTTMTLDLEKSRAMLAKAQSNLWQELFMLRRKVEALEKDQAVNKAQCLTDEARGPRQLGLIPLSDGWTVLDQGRDEDVSDKMQHPSPEVQANPQGNRQSCMASPPATRRRITEKEKIRREELGGEGELAFLRCEHGKANLFPHLLVEYAAFAREVQTAVYALDSVEASVSRKTDFSTIGFRNVLRNLSDALISVKKRIGVMEQGIYKVVDPVEQDMSSSLSDWFLLSEIEGKCRQKRKTESYGPEELKAGSEWRDRE